MSEDANPWASAVPAWVTLAQLLVYVERELGIPHDRAANALRAPLESFAVRTAVFGYSASAGSRIRKDWIASDQSPGHPTGYCISQQGWAHVDRINGSLAGCEVLVCWRHVVGELSLLPHMNLRSASQGSAGQSQSVGGAPARYDWEAFWIEVALYAAKHDLSPEYRHELHKHMVAWAAREWASVVDEATIRGRLSRLFKLVNVEKRSA